MTTGTLTRLQVGMVVLYEGRRHRVALVNECRAKIVPLEKRVKEFLPRTGANAGRPVLLVTEACGHNISPESELEVIEERRRDSNDQRDERKAA